MAQKNPQHIIQTSTEAKAAYKRNGYTISSQKQRCLERGAELDERAQRIREKEKRRVFLKKQREQREKKEREARERNGVSIATQSIGYSLSQAESKRRMEAFLGYSKNKKADKKADKKELQDEKKDLEADRKLEVIGEESEKEPWDDDDGLESELPELDATIGNGEDCYDDDLDDNTLIEAHDLALSDPVEESLPKPQGQPQIAIGLGSPVKFTSPVPRQLPKEGREFLRLHGPIDKNIETVLDRFPTPVVEVLSQDTPKDTALWNPSASLLHKLNSHGLPPHRLRFKVGCVVVLLRELNIGSQLSKSQYLQILCVEKERLECLVLDGQLKGTKTLVTRTMFTAYHHNDKRHPFQRLQFPVKVSKDCEPVKVSKEPGASSFKMPMKKPATTNPTPQVKPVSNSHFKLPMLPASKCDPIDNLAASDPDVWDSFLDSSTQIARELCEERPVATKPSSPRRYHRSASSHTLKEISQLSAKDFDSSGTDSSKSSLGPLAVKEPAPKQPLTRIPSKHATATNTGSPRKPISRVHSLQLSARDFDFLASDLSESSLVPMAVKESTPRQPSGRTSSKHVTTTHAGGSRGPISRAPFTSSLRSKVTHPKRKFTPDDASASGSLSKKPVIQVPRPLLPSFSTDNRGKATLPPPPPPLPPAPANEFWLSTQDVTMFDEDMDF